MSIALIGSCSSIISNDEVDSVSTIFKGNKVEIVVPFERKAGENGGDSVSMRRK